MKRKNCLFLQTTILYTKNSKEYIIKPVEVTSVLSKVNRYRLTHTKNKLHLYILGAENQKSILK